MGEELRFSWANAREVIDTDDSVEVIMEPTGIAVIPKRIFDEPAELQKWVEFIRDHMGKKAIGGDYRPAVCPVYRLNPRINRKSAFF